MVIMMLQGSPITYYGDEIGMSDNDNIKNDDERDPYRTPMQWDDTSNAGKYVWRNMHVFINSNMISTISYNSLICR